jgi:signal transduction histidine kinase
MLASLQQASDAQQRFVSDASHELRAPLTIIQANLDLLERMPALPAEERAEILGEASRETHRLSQLVADLLALARADAGIALQRRRVELDRVLLEAVGDARHLARGQRLEIDALEPVVVSGDPDRLRQLLLALLDNAVKYTPAGGRIGVALARDSTNARLTVSDDGVGIPATDLPHVFDRFYRADPARSRDPGGTGLGLPIARWIVEQHGGDITVTSEPGEGTQVRIQLPVIA